MISPTSFSVAAETDQIITETLTIHNVGTGDLSWSLSIDASDWLSVDPSEGVLASGGSEPVTLIIDATGLAAGTYTASLTLTSNDLDEPTLTIPVDLTVLAGSLSIAGQAVYYSTADPIEGILFELTGDDTQTTTTTADGAYAFDVAASGSYTVTPTLGTDAPPSRGVSTLDIALIRRHILGIEPLDTPYKIIAADVNNDSKVTTLDIVLIRRVILGLDQGYPGGALWAFVPAAFVFPDPENPFPFPDHAAYIDLTMDIVEDYVGIKRGDVNHSWSPPEAAKKAQAK